MLVIIMVIITGHKLSTIGMWQKDGLLLILKGGGFFWLASEI